MHESIAATDQAERLRHMVAPARNAKGPQAAVATPAAYAPISVGPANAAERVRTVHLARAIAVSSGKGGVGKTNLAVNLAVAFAERGARTVLLDADLGLANADVLAGLSPRATLEDVVAGDCTLAEVMVHAPGGFRLVPGASGVSRLADLGQSQRRCVLEQLLELERSTDVLIIDTGAGIGANSMAFSAAAHSILVTTTPEPTAIADAYGAVKTLVSRGRRDGLQLVVNMALSDEEARTVHGRIDRVAKAFLNARISYAGALPHDAAVPRAVRRREPVALLAPEAPFSRAVRQLARGLAGESPEPIRADVRQGFLGRLASMLTRR